MWKAVLVMVALVFLGQFGLAVDIDTGTADEPASYDLSSADDVQTLTSPLRVDTGQLPEDAAFRSDEDAPAQTNSMLVPDVLEPGAPAVVYDGDSAEKLLYFDDTPSGFDASAKWTQQNQSNSDDQVSTERGTGATVVFGRIIENEVDPGRVYADVVESTTEDARGGDRNIDSTAASSAEDVDAGPLSSSPHRRRTQQTSVRTDGSNSDRQHEPVIADADASASVGLVQRTDDVGNHKWTSVVGLMGHRRRPWGNYHTNKHIYGRKTKSQTRSGSVHRPPIYGSLVHTQTRRNHHHHHHHHPHHKLHPVRNRYQSWPDRQTPLQYIVAPQRSNEEDYLPPYIKKYNRRNKQLLNLMEGTDPPPAAPANAREVYNAKMRAIHHKHRKTHQKTKAQWLEANLFEEQRPQLTTNDNVSPQQHSANDLPGLDGPARSEILDSDEIVFSSDIQDTPTVIDMASTMYNVSPAANESTTTIQKPKSTASRLNHFQFHRVASPRLVGAGSYGLLRKQRLPFVAITDRRLSHPDAVMHKNPTRMVQ